MPTAMGQCIKRLRKEHANLQCDPLPTDIGSAQPVNDNDLLHWNATIHGPANTPYVGRTFALDIDVPETYPWKPFQLRFNTPIVHPNVSGVGDVLLPDLAWHNWCPAVTIRMALVSLQALLSDPNVEEGCVLNEQAARLYLNDTFVERLLRRPNSAASET